MRFLITGEWTPWYDDDADLSFLKNNIEITAMEETATITKAEWKILEDKLEK